MNALEVLEIKTMLRTILSSFGKLESKIMQPAPTQLCEMELKLRHARKQLLPEYLGDIAWDILLSLDHAEREGRPYFASDVANESDIPLTTALRYLGKLEADGLIKRVGDAQDRRRTKVALTDAGRELLLSVLNSALTAMERDQKVTVAPLPVMIG